MSGKLPVPFSISAGCENLPPVVYTSGCASAMTLYAASEVILRLMEPMRVQCGIALGLPPELMGIISCHPAHAELGVMAATETLGADDRGPVSVLLTWITNKSIVIAGSAGSIATSPDGDSGAVRRALNHGLSGEHGILRAARLTINRGDPIAMISFMPLARVHLVAMRELRSAPGLPRDQAPAKTDGEHSDWG